jgi:uncharacterized protein
MALIQMPNAKCQIPNAKWLALVLTISLLALPSIASAQPAPPALTETVNDFAHIIDPGSRAELDRRINALTRATGDVIAIATVPTFKPFGSIDEYAVKMFENGGRGIGEKTKHNGLLIVVAVEDRAVRIETGYGLEEFIPDGFAGETIREAIKPAFREGKYGQGLLDGTTRLIHRIAERKGVPLPDVPADAPLPSSRRNVPVHFPWTLLFWIVVVLIAVSRNNRRPRRRYWGAGPWSNWTGGPGSFGGGGFGGSGGSFGGGGGGFGGGGFSGGGSGGGGASGGW